MIYILLAVASGAMISLQSSYNGMLYPFLGVVGVGCISNLLNALCTMLYRLATTRKLPHVKGMPFYYSFGGLFAVVVLGSSGYLVSRLGTAVTVCLSVSGQLFTSAVFDHFGLFGTEQVRFKAIRIPGFLCILSGIIIINFSGSQAFGNGLQGGVLLLLLLYAIFIGGLTVFARMFNYKASVYLGKMDGNFINSITGAGAALVVWLIVCKGQLPLSGLTQAPMIAYLTGPLGFVACIMNMTVYSKMKIFHATIFLLIGQITASILTDLVLIGQFSAGKILGIAVICIGIALDKNFSRQKEQ